MTIISHKHRFIFVRPNKVASNSMMVALSNLCGNEDIIACHDDDRTRFSARNDHVFQDLPKRYGRASPGAGGDILPWHILPEVVKDRVGADLWNDYFKFTVVRNPWDWFASLYRHRLLKIWPRAMQSQEATWRSRLLKMRTRYRHKRTRRDFEIGRHRQNVELILRRKWFAKYLAIMPAFYLLEGRQYADHYIRFEALQQDYDEVCRRLQLPCQTLPCLNVTAAGGAHDYRDYYTEWSSAYLGQQCSEVVAAFSYRF